MSNIKHININNYNYSRHFLIKIHRILYAKVFQLRLEIFILILNKGKGEDRIALIEFS